MMDFINNILPAGIETGAAVLFVGFIAIMVCLMIAAYIECRAIGKWRK